MNLENEPTIPWLERPVSNFLPKIKIEQLIIVAIIVLAVISRFYILGARVMSHDEVNHVVPSWGLSIGNGYVQDPVTHGPLQFHLIALTYFLFGDSDFTSRVPAALSSLAAVVVVLLLFKRYLGRWGHLIAGFLFLISPYMLFYGRYTRNEGIIELVAVLMIYATLRYLDRGDTFSLILLVVTQALNFTLKETAYIYMAQLLLFLAIQFVIEVTKEHWPTARNRKAFIASITAAISLILMGIGLAYAHLKENPVNENGEAIASSGSTLIGSLGNLAVILALAAGIFAVFILLRELGISKIRHLRTFDLLMVNGTLTLPLLTAFPITILASILNQDWRATDYSSMGILRIAIALVILAALSTVIGLWWNRNKWIKTTIIFWSIFMLFYTTFFTNGQGFFTGIVGSLGYWLEQQAVNRGSQPTYYYWLLQVPFYEYLAAAGTLVAVIFGIRYVHKASIPVAVPIEPYHGDAHSIAEKTAENAPEYLMHENVTRQKTAAITSVPQPPDLAPLENSDLTAIERAHSFSYRVPVLFMLVFYSLTSLLAYSLAGEKMPWLTVHIALPLLLTAGWGINLLIESTPWKKLTERKGWLVILLLPVLLASFSGLLMALGRSPAPFTGNSLEHLKNTTSFVFAVIGFLASLYGISTLLKDWKPSQIVSLMMVLVFALLSVLTIRTSLRANYINYDNGKEFLVYAHADRGPKDILEQIEEISRRTVGENQLVVAYDNDSLYPYWWYLRHYSNKIWYTDKPTRDLLNAPVILASDANWSKIDALTKNEYSKFEYTRLVWPMQDYYFLTWDRVRYGLLNPGMRSALFDIWLNRDYSAYATLKERNNLTVATWEPGNPIRMYLRKDILAEIWNYGSRPAQVSEPEVDPYEGKIELLPADRYFGGLGDQPGQLNAPHGLAVSQDGSLFVADSLNHRIQHFSKEGVLINSWGSFADIATGNAPGGTFNEPWGIAIGPEGSLYVTDTWNHRVQKFDQNGNFLLEWGYFGTAETPDGFWGPRGIAVSPDGQVFVTDTGNKRVVVFDSNGVYLSQFGEAGFDIGQLDEPVGISIGLNGEVYVADTWNQRIQVFIPNADKTSYFAANSWEVNGWFGQSLENKPFIATDRFGNVYLTDPEGYRILVFQPDGTFLRGWGGYSPGPDGFGLPAAVALDPNSGEIWVSDSGNHLILHFPAPQ